MGARRHWFHWYQVLLTLTALLQVLLIGAPLSFASNWDDRVSGYLHPAWITVETHATDANENLTTVIWAWENIWLAMLTVSMLGLAIFMIYIGYIRPIDRAKLIFINFGIFAFLLQIVGSYFVARTVFFHVPDARGDIEFLLLPEFFIQCFPPIFLFFARLRIKRRMRRESEREERE